MTALVVGLLIIICGLLCAILWKLSDVLSYERESYTELQTIKRHQLNPRTRIGGPIAVQSGEVSEEQHLARLGRASSARRIVVGGDHDSQLNNDLANQAVVGRSYRGGEDDE